MPALVAAGAASLANVVAATGAGRRPVDALAQFGLAVVVRDDGITAAPIHSAASKHIRLVPRRGLLLILDQAVVADRVTKAADYRAGHGGLLDRGFLLGEHVGDDVARCVSRRDVPRTEPGPVLWGQRGDIRDKRHDPRARLV
ncbi:unannotated protein [freshwater metagenome]|uniref:Unannotated protein n=1 Tax=freshwater metagenome TaxID=449393 RepID=A0A6J6EX09_9ZZZZ